MTTKLTPEEARILENTNKRIFRYLILPLIGLIILILLVSSYFEKKELIQAQVPGKEVKK
jgi:hypothetical protein